MARKRMTITKKEWEDVEWHCTVDSSGEEAWDFAADWFKASAETVVLVIENRRLVGRPLLQKELVEFQKQFKKEEATA